MGGDLKKFAEAQKQVRAKMKGVKLVRLVPHRDSIVQHEQPDEFRSVEQTLTELFGAHLKKRWAKIGFTLALPFLTLSSLTASERKSSGFSPSRKVTAGSSQICRCVILDVANSEWRAANGK